MDGTDTEEWNDDSDIEILEESVPNPKTDPGITELLIKIDRYKKENSELESSSLELQQTLGILENQKVQIETNFNGYISEVANMMRESKNRLSEKTAIIQIFKDKVEQLRYEIKNIKEKLSSSKRRIQNAKNGIENDQKISNSSDKFCQTEFKQVDKEEYSKLEAEHFSSVKEKEEFDRLLVAERSHISNLKQLIKNATHAKTKLISKMVKVRKENYRKQTLIKDNFMELSDFIKRKRQKFELRENLVVLKQMESESHLPIQKEETSESESSSTSSSSGDTLDFKRRKKIKNSAQFECDMCKRRYETKGRLYTHIHTVHAEKTFPKWFECDVCGRRFSSKGRVYGHIHSVHSILQHKCEICKTTFSSKGNCMNHIRTLHPKKEVQRITKQLGRVHSVCRLYSDARYRNK